MEPLLLSIYVRYYMHIKANGITFNYLTTKEWVAFRRKFSEVLNGLQPLYAKLP